MSQLFDPTRERLNQSPLNNPNLLSGPYWDELRTFLAVAKSKSFNRAAMMLNKSQPSVSRSIHRLQTMVGSQLLLSSKKGIVLTERGRELAEALIAFDQQLSTLSQNLRAESTEAAGTVSFSSTEAIAGLFVVPKIPKFSEDHPKIRLHLRTITNLISFRENQSDIVLSFSPCSQAGVESRAVGHLHLMPYASRQYIARKGMPTRDNLANHAFLDAEYYSSRTEIWRDWRTAVESGTLAHICDDPFAYCRMVRDGMGIGLLGNYVISNPELVPLDLGIHVDLAMYLQAATERLQSKPVRIVYDWLASIVGQRNEWFRTEFKLVRDLRSVRGEALDRIMLSH